MPVEGTDRATGERSESGAAVDGQWRVAGESGMPLVVTGKGDTMQGAREQAYGRVDDILIPNCYYRDDIGERWIEATGTACRHGAISALLCSDVQDSVPV